MKKTVIVHTRVTPETKKECDEIFNKLGITTSYAITMFLNQVSLRKGIPFDIEIPEKESILSTSIGISSLGGGKPSEEAKKIMRLYVYGHIDYETAEFAIMKLHEKKHNKVNDNNSFKKY